MSGERALEEFYTALVDDDAAKLYDRAPCGYLSTTPDGLIVKVNQTFLTLTGYAADELAGERRFVDLLTGGGRIYHETHYRPMLQMQGSAREIALDLVCADGRRLPVLVNSVLERDHDGRPVVIRTAVFDATERRGYERELMHARRRAEDSEARATSLARTLQQTLIPPSPPSVPGLDLAARYRPAGDGEEVGGDFYDVFEIGDDDWVVAIGDVCGKGVEAAVVTSLARYSLRSACVRERSPSRALAEVNAALVAHGTERYCTVALLRLRRGSVGWTGTLSLAGHPLPQLVRAGAGPVAVGTPGTLLGILTDPQLYDTQVDLGPGDGLVLFTDGVTEGRRQGDFYGLDRLTDSIRRWAGPAERLAEGVVDDVLAFQSGTARDDIAVVAVVVPS